MTKPFDYEEELQRTIDASGLSRELFNSTSAAEMFRQATGNFSPDVLSTMLVGQNVSESLSAKAMLAQHLTDQTTNLRSVLQSVSASSVVTDLTLERNLLAPSTETLSAPIRMRADYESLMKVGCALQDALGPATSLFKAPDLTYSELALGVRSLTRLSDIASGISPSATNDYAATLTAIGSAADIASAFLKTSPFEQADLGSNLISRFLTSASAVEIFESSLIGASRTLEVNTAELKHGLSLTAVESLHRDMLELVSISRSDIDHWLNHASQSSWRLLNAPAHEIYTSALSARILAFDTSDYVGIDAEHEAEIDEQIDAFESNLAELDSELVVVYRGALSALDHKGPDWRRHVMTSFRELLTHVLHKLAPDEIILPLAGSQDLADGKPTRRFRFNFIFTLSDGMRLGSFFDADMKAAVELFRVLNEETHRVGHVVSPEEVRYIKSRLVGLVTSMMDAHRIKQEDD